MFLLLIALIIVVEDQQDTSQCVISNEEFPIFSFLFTINMCSVKSVKKEKEQDGKMSVESN